MQYYNLTTVDEPTAAQADALREISTKVTETLEKIYGAGGAKIGCRIATSKTLANDHMIVDVDLGDELLPIDLETWALFPENYDRAVECAVARVREILARRDAILDHLAELRARVEAVIAGKGGLVTMVGFHFWPIEGSYGFRRDELRLELRVEQFGFDPETMELRRYEESYHGYGVRELTNCIREQTALQHRMTELRRLLDEAGVTATLDLKSQFQLVEGKVPPVRIAERLIANSGRNDATARR